MTEQHLLGLEGGVKPLKRFHLFVPRDNEEEIEQILKEHGFRFKKSEEESPIRTFYINRKNGSEGFLNTIQESLLPLA